LSEGSSEARRKHGAGWYVGAAVFWLIAFWLVFVGLSSIIPEVFWPAAEASASGQGSCAESLRSLESELLERSSRSIAGLAAKGEREALASWLEAWDHRLQGAAPTCNETERKAAAELSRLRFGMSGLIQRFDREQTPLLRKIDALLGPRAAAPLP